MIHRRDVKKTEELKWKLSLNKHLHIKLKGWVYSAFFYKIKMIIRKRDRYLLSILSGVLMVLSFPFTGSLSFLGFVAWIPLLIVEDTILNRRFRSGKVFIHAYLTFLIYNIGTTWWIYYASPGGAYLAFVLNSFLMAITFYLYHIARRNINKKFGLIFLIIFWIGFEHAHYHWELSWPWLTLGNIFSTQPYLVQWYEITGVMGGSIWILLVNYLLFEIVLLAKSNQMNKKKIIWKKSGFCLVIILIPTLFSVLRYFNFDEEINPVEVVVVQPNIDPYNEKFMTDSEGQIKQMLELADATKTSQTKFILFPETAISTSFEEKDLTRNSSVQIISDYLTKNPQVHILTGASTYQFFDKKKSIASKEIPNSNEFIEFYNSSLAIDNESEEVIHKSKLVLGVEKIPFSQWMPFLEDLSINNGGTSGTLGQEKEPKSVRSRNGNYAPVVCYESIYGEFVSQQVQKGAELIFIITNDGWWKDTPGYKQHNSFASLRAIETRKSVARSANTGTSSFVNQKGDILKQTQWWKKDAIRLSLNKNNTQTFYVRFGDLIYRFTNYLALSLIFASLFLPLYKMITNKKEPSN